MVKSAPASADKHDRLEPNDVAGHAAEFVRALVQRFDLKHPGGGFSNLGNPLDNGRSHFSRLCNAFGLTAFERAVLMLCVVSEAEPIRFRRLAAMFYEYPENPTMGAVTPHLALHWFDGGDPRAFLGDAPLMRWGFVQRSDGKLGEGLTLTNLNVDPAILAYIHGDERINPRLTRHVENPPRGASLTTRQEGMLDDATAFLRRSDAPVLQLHGSDPEGAAVFAQRVLAGLGRPVLHVSAARLLAGKHPEEDLMLWERETRLRDLALVVNARVSDANLPEDRAAPDRVEAFLSSFAQGVHAPVALLTEEPLSLRGNRPSLLLEVGKPAAREQRELWAAELGLPDTTDPRLARLTDQFNLTASKLRSVAHDVLLDARPDKHPLERAWHACRLRGRQSMGGLAERLAGNVTWDDLILPDDDMSVLRQLVTHVRHRSRVYEEWGMGKLGRGLGISALFSGPSGTGKTLAAEVIAQSLDLDLYRIDLSSMVSKYIGETEKNLKRIFDAADDGGTILLFDEADSLFGKRSDVKDSHDRYANLQVNYLLQRMESYAGLAILTTNLESSMDTAFMRRIRFILNFRQPEGPERRRIWQRVFPAQVDVSHLDFDRLARVKLAGGNIRSVALNAAFMAAAQDSPLTMPILREAIQAEWRKLGKVTFEDRTFTDW